MELPERDQRNLEKKCAHLLNDGTEKDDRSEQDKEAEKELEEPPEHWADRVRMWLMNQLFLYYHCYPDHEANAIIAESKIANGICRAVRIVFGICGCILCLWVLWPNFVALTSTGLPYANLSLATFSVQIMLLWCAYCIFVFLYSLFGFGGKIGKYLRLAAQIVLAVMFCLLWLAPNSRFFPVYSAEQLFQIKTGILVAFMCLFPRIYDGGKFDGWKLLALTVLLYICIIWERIWARIPSIDYIVYIINTIFIIITLSAFMAFVVLFCFFLVSKSNTE